MTQLYDAIGSTFHATRRSDPSIVALLREELELSADGCYLDLGCGTGNYTAALQALGGAWHGLDSSPSMLERAAQQSPSIRWTCAGAESLPFPDATFQSVMCVNAIHLFDIGTSLREARRVLADGRLVIFGAFGEQISGYWLREYFPGMIERCAKLMPSLAYSSQQLHDNGLELVKIRTYDVTQTLADLFLYSGKQRPWLYLQPMVRQNMSQFVRWCDRNELAHGLARLENDIDSGAFPNVAARYPTLNGDCAFLVARRALNV
jgi:ubiquinone/menaquinone biosynthesis C-methylase UbiE